MKIVFISQFSELVGGGEHSLLDLMRHLPAPHSPELIVPEEGELSRRAEDAGIACHQLPLPKVGLATPAAFWRWRKWLIAERPALVHANSSRAALYAALAARGTGIPVLFHCRVAQRDPLMDMLLHILCDRIICNSHAVAARFPASSGKVQVIHNGLELPQGALSNHENRMLFLGRFDDVKQPHIALEVFEELADAFPDWQLDLAGGDGSDAAYMQRLERKIGESRYADRIQRHGHVNEPGALLSHAGILLLPSRHEAFGRVLVEAMAYGVPIVAFRVGGVPEVVEDGVQGTLVQPEDIQAMAKACQQLMQDEALRTRMGEAGNQRAGMFSIEAHARKVAALYETVLHD